MNGKRLVTAVTSVAAVFMCELAVAGRTGWANLVVLTPANFC